jgi:serine-type D-Ala-D-Ala carboxypeptidase/endopeptidase (penicillin-binding protein 4)
MRRAALFGYLLILLLSPPARADLTGDINAILKDKGLGKASVGVEIVRLGRTDADSKEIFQRDARTPLTPASNLKLTTTSAFLDHVGPDFKFHTTLLEHGGDLVLIGDGDPSFGDAEYLRRVGWKTTTVFENWAAQLKKLNIKSVRNVIVDDGIFDQQFFNPDWSIKQLDHWYEAQVGGMNLNTNCIDFYVKPTKAGVRVEYGLVPNTRYVTVDNSCVTGINDVQLGRKPGTNDIELKGKAPPGNDSPFQETIQDPPMYAATVLAETIGTSGIPVSGQVVRDRTASQQRQTSVAGAWKVIGINQTPLAVALARANKDSINVYAECLCKRLGHETSHAAGSWENGTAAVGAFLRKAGVAETEFHLDDGSGLSRQNRISPHALGRVLSYDFHSRNHDAFINSLSIAGVDGTLERRFAGTDLRRRVMAKSGFVDGVSCLSGYLKTRDGQWYAFSIMMNHLGATGLGKAVQEKIVRAVDANAATLSAQR